MFYLRKIIVQKNVKYCMSHQQRSLIAQLRLGILPIHIETGRFRGTQLDMSVM